MRHLANQVSGVNSGLTLFRMISLSGWVYIVSRSQTLTPTDVKGLAIYMRLVGGWVGFF